MRSKHRKLNVDFIGRKQELALLSKIASAEEAQILIIYGRRRVGKTELIEQAYHDRKLLKFEGLEGLNEIQQMAEVMRQLSVYAEQALLAKISVSTWQEVFEYIGEVISKGAWTLYFEELQWLANYKIDFISALKYAWDNSFRHNKKLLLILCGSSPSFMIKQVVHSKALYNRSTHEIALNKLSLLEVQQLFKNCSQQEVMDTYLTIGGIPEYLQWLKKGPSLFLAICQHAFKKNGSFLREFDKIFISSLADSPHYRKIIEFLAKHRFASRADLAANLKISSGGTLTKLLEDLELCEFIQKYTPYNLNATTPIARYCINDEYLQFFYRFIKPIEKRVQAGEFNQNPSHAISMDRYRQWLGYAFERFCRQYYFVIAHILGFSGVDFNFGAFFSRATDKSEPGYQIDLLFERKDKVVTICEVKYLQGKVSRDVVDDFERKLKLFPNKKQHTIQRVLITNIGAEQSLLDMAYFDRVISFKEIFDENNWK